MHQAKRGAGASLYTGTTLLHMVAASLHMVTTSLHMCTAFGVYPPGARRLRGAAGGEPASLPGRHGDRAPPRLRVHGVQPLASVPIRSHSFPSSRIVSHRLTHHAPIRTLTQPLTPTPLTPVAHPRTPRTFSPRPPTYPAGAHPPRGIPGQVRLRPNREGLPRAAPTRHVCVSMYRPSAYPRPRLCAYQARMCTATHRPSCAARVPPCVALACLALPHQAGRSTTPTSVSFASGC